MVGAGPWPEAAPEPPAPGGEGDEFVRWAQGRLNAILGLALPTDGVLGGATRAAIRDFQRRAGLPADGFLGPPTEAALRRVGETVAASGGAPAGTTGGEEMDGMSGATRFEVVPFAPAAWGASGGQPDRRRPDYVRWVQRSLNRLAGPRVRAGLAEDGQAGPRTRAAVQAFQRRAGLAADGVVGAQTERALVAAGAGQPPGAAGPVPAPVPAPAPAPTGGNGLAGLRQAIVRLATQEWQRWGQGAIKEGDARVRATLDDYWSTGTGTRFTEPGWWSANPWSAAFISWVLRRAGAGPDFAYSAGHAVYTKAAKDNRLAGNRNPFKAYRIEEAAPRVGDLVCRSRAGSGATYDNIQPGMSTHCDIVTEVRPGELATIGGNVSDSVGLTKVPTDEGGRVRRPDYFAVIRVG